MKYEGVSYRGVKFGKWGKNDRLVDIDRTTQASRYN